MMPVMSHSKNSHPSDRKCWLKVRSAFWLAGPHFCHLSIPPTRFISVSFPATCSMSPTMSILLPRAYIDDAVVLLPVDDPLCSGAVCVYVILSSNSSSVGSSCTLGRTRTRMRFGVFPPLLPPLLDTVYYSFIRIHLANELTVMTSSQTISATLLPRLIEVSAILVIILCTRPYNLAVLQHPRTRAHIIVFQDLARSLLPLASTTTTHHDIKLK
ncbi:hypothetical protein B0H14DRAFT_2829037 [Mycena olivaceomarginata]|nr:hypothetical protein B0H14DRAFT_2829037 [Mycena olivaceomarginata]